MAEQHDPELKRFIALFKPSLNGKRTVNSVKFI